MSSSKNNQPVLLPAETCDDKNCMASATSRTLEDCLAHTALEYFIYHSGYVKRKASSAILYPEFEQAFRSWLEQESVEFSFNAQILHRIIEKLQFTLTYRGSDNPVDGDTGLAILGLEVDAEIVVVEEEGEEEDDDEDEDDDDDDDDGDEDDEYDGAM